MAREFRGRIELDIRDSTPDRSAFLPAPAPPGSPNVLVVLFDDTGMAAWSPYGGRINMPTLDRLARDGLTYSQWHTTALSSPTRSCFPTGRNRLRPAPLVISWPAGSKARGEVRHQYHHAIDIVPTILDCCGVPMPDVVGGVAQTPLPGVSMRYSFDDADAPTTKHTQSYEMLGTRALWHEGSEQVLAGDAPLHGHHVLGVEFTKQRSGEHHESVGPARLHVDGVTLAEAEIRTMTGQFSPRGGGLCVGYDSGDAVTDAYRPRFAFTDGSIVRVVFDVGDDLHADAAGQLAAAMSR